MNVKLNLEGSQDLPLREVVFHTLREAILTEQLQPGERLMEIQLAESLGVSRTPIREAIHKLEQEGLVVTKPRKGAEVASITEKQLRDVLEVRIALETLAVKLVCERISERQLEDLEQAHAHMAGMIQKNGLVEIVNADIRFHQIIYMAADNERLLQILNNLRQQMYRYRLEYLKHAENLEVVLEEHRNILDALYTYDQEKAVEATCRHILNQEHSVMANIEKSEKPEKQDE